MRKLLFALLLAGCTTAPQPDFVFRPERVPVGRVVHYVKSNLDGSKPALVSVYFASPTRIEVYKSEKDVDDAADVHAELDYTMFSPRMLDAGVIFDDGTREHRAKLEFDGKTVTATIGGATASLPAPFTPLHTYNFDLMGLSAMLPHLRDDGSFRVAFVEPTFGEGPSPIANRGIVTATRHGDTYSLAGELFPHGATLRINPSDGLLESFESATPNNPGWNSLRLRRRGSESMTRAQWDTYRKSHVGKGAD